MRYYAVLGFLCASFLPLSSYAQAPQWHDSGQRLGGTIDLLNGGTSTVLLDLDGDSKPELIARSFEKTRIWTFDSEGRALPTDTIIETSSQGLAVGDLDGDNRLDLLLTGSSTSVWLGTEQGSFEPHNTPTDISGTRPNLVDINGDDALDIVIQDNRSGHSVWLGAGDGTFTEIEQTALEPQFLTPFIFGDFDGDGRTEWAATGDNELVVWEIDDNEDLQSKRFTSPDGYVLHAATDIDDDGTSELLLSNATQYTFLPWQKYTAQSLEDAAPAPPNLTEVELGEIHVRDIDGDGDHDLFAIASTNDSTAIVSGGIYVWPFEDGAWKAPEGPWTAPLPFGLALGDVDNDGDLDAVVASLSMSYVMLQGPKRDLSPLDPAPWRGPIATDTTFKLRVDPLENPADLREGLQLWSETRGQIAWEATDAEGALHVRPTSPLLAGEQVWLAQQSPSLQLGTQFEGSHFTPMAFTNTTTWTFEVQSLPGNGFMTVSNTPWEGDFLAVGDLDSDGFPECVVTSERNNTTGGIFSHNGQGGFKGFTVPAGFPTKGKPAVMDVNDDGFLDVVVQHREMFGSTERSIWLGDGAGGLQESTLLTTNSNAAVLTMHKPAYAQAYAVTYDDTFEGARIIHVEDDFSERPIYWGSGEIPEESWLQAIQVDLQQDGFPDIVVRTENTIYFLIGQAYRTFLAFLQPPLQIINADSIAVGDINNDGWSDLVVGTFSHTQIWFGAGEGPFVKGPDLDEGGDALSLKDANGDGNLDLLVAGTFDTSLWWGDGAGNFTHEASVDISRGNQGILVDVNGDLRLDIVTASGEMRIQGALPTEQETPDTTTPIDETPNDNPTTVTPASGGGDDGCSVHPKHTPTYPGVLLLLVGMLWLARRR